MISVEGDSPLVSVFMPAYNQQGFIAAAIDSVLKQDYDHIELIVGDDCSQDNTWEIIKKSQEKYPAIIKAFRNDENLGITANCNKVLARCSGKYIAFTAGDDLFLPGKITAQVAWLEENEDRVLCGHQVEVFYEDGSQSHILRPSLPSGKGPQWVIENGCPYGGVSIMVRTNSIPEKGYDDRIPNVAELLFWIDCLKLGGEFGYVPGVLARYRRHTNNVTSNVQWCFEGMKELYSILEQEYDEYSASIKKGIINQIDIGKAKKLLSNNQFFQGITLLLWSYIRSPSRLYRTFSFKLRKVTGKCVSREN